MAPKYTDHKIVNHEDDTHQLACKIASILRPSDVILLCGEIGAGKTSFARAVIQTLLAKAGLYEEIPSPSFTLVQTYSIDGQEIWHSDLYRLLDPSEVEELGLLDAFSTAICLVEWPDRLGDIVPKNALTISFDFDANSPEQERKIDLSFDNPRWQPVLDMI